MNNFYCYGLSNKKTGNQLIFYKKRLLVNNNIQ